MKYLLITFIILFSTVAVSSAGESYLLIKGGAFLPNGDGDGTTAGLNQFNAGYNIAGGFGYYAAEYAVIEATAGMYATERTDSASGASTTAKVTSIPLTAAIKGVYRTDPLEFSAGGGICYLISAIDYTNAAGNATSHGNSLGYLLTGGADMLFSEKFSAGVDITWLSAKPEIDLSKIGAGSMKWQMGGTTMNLALKYRFH